MTGQPLPVCSPKTGTQKECSDGPHRNNGVCHASIWVQWVNYVNRYGAACGAVFNVLSDMHAGHHLFLTF